MGDLLEIPQSGENALEGKTDACPVAFEGHSADDMRALLWTFYAKCVMTFSCVASTLNMYSQTTRDQHRHYEPKLPVLSTRCRDVREVGIL